MPNKKATFLILLFGMFLFYQPVLAESYDLYVDKDCESTQDGSSDKPYCTISDALEKASSSKNKIYIKSGTYKEKLVLEKKIGIYGKDAADVIIENSGDGSTVLGEGDNTIKNITVKGGHDGIVLKKEGIIEKCIIKNASKNAINLLSNDGKVEIKNNEITDNGKGMYIQAGRIISIHDNEITENSEEGIDLRADVNGSIKNNTVSKNGEGGIELVVGKANLIISNNTITKNRASGVAAQFYSSTSKTGEIVISNNKINENKDYGLTCKNTLGGSYSKDYWDKSIELSANSIEKNKIKAIDPNCHIIEAVDKEEEEEQKIVEIDEAEEAETDEQKAAADEEKKKQEEKEAAILEEINNIESILENYIAVSDSISEEIKNRGKIKVFFFGFDKKKIATLKNLNSRIEESKKILGELNLLTQEISTKEKSALIIKNFNSTLNKNQELISEKSAKKGIFGWLKNIFN